MSGYTSTTDADRAAMLAAIGVDSVEELFDGVPAEVRMDRPLDLPDGLTEAEVYGRMRELASRNADAESEICFLGAGMYDHYVPAIVDAITSRSEFLTPYTPYQPEISQGGLQVMFEFQTAMTELTGLPLSSAGLYEGPSTVAAAAYLAIGATKRRGLVVSQGLHPDSRETVRTYAAGFPADVTEVPLVDGVTDADALAAAIGEDTAAVFVQYPSFVGGVEDLERLAAIAHDAGALLVASCDPIALGILRTPGECGVDIAVGEGQPLGNRLDFGGPSFGFFAATEAYLRRMPGRIAGETRDVDGRRGFVLTLQTREQHIRREKATSNICTAQVLLAVMASMYAVYHGPAGWLGSASFSCAAPPTRRPSRGDRRVELLHDARWCASSRSQRRRRRRGVLEHCASRSIAAGVPLDLEYGNGLLIAITEQRTKEHIDLLADALAEAVGAAVPVTVPAGAQSRGRRRRLVSSAPPTSAAIETPMQRDRATTIFERSVEERRAAAIPAAGVPQETPIEELIPSAACCVLGKRGCPRSRSRRSSATTTTADLAPQLRPRLRHLPALGSCTMKHNPRLNERVAALPGHARLHPARRLARQGALELMVAGAGAE